MQKYDPDVDVLFILDALDAGVVPSEAAAEELVAMGLLERRDNGTLVMTVAARIRQCELRARLYPRHAPGHAGARSTG